MKKSLLLILGLLLTTSLFAGPVGKEEAKAKALAFLNGTVSQRAGVAKAPRRLQDLSLASSGDAYHVFNIGASNGFVIVSGSDLTPDIIGYTDEGAFDAQNIPDNMNAWLQGYADQIEWVEKNGEQVTESKVRKAPATSTVKSAIAPLIQTKWAQDAPYNGMVPSGCVTGCVATAMAQMLYYCANKPGFPQGTSKVIPSYTDANSHYIESCEKITSFDWSNMQLTYTGTESATLKNAVAKLMKYCGASVNMKYGSTSSSSTLKVANSLNEYFGYDHHLRNVYRNQYSSAEWEDLIYQELVESRPVLYSGSSSGGGHAFICDGYDADGYFHINWGWGGNHDGYYLLSLTNPEKGGTGSGLSPDGYTMDQDAVIGFHKPEIGFVEEDTRVSCQKFDYTGTSVVPKNQTSFQFDFTTHLKSELTYSYTFVMGVGVYDSDNNLVNTVYAYTGDFDFTPSGETDVTYKYYLNLKSLTAGIYKIKQMSSISGSDVFNPCKSSDDYYVQAVVDDDNVTFSNIGPNTNLVVSDMKLVTDGVEDAIQTLTAKIKNTGSDAYHGNIYLYKGSTQYSGLGLHLESGESSMIELSFIPTDPGTEEWVISTDIANLANFNLTIGSAVPSDNTPTLTSVHQLNLSGTEILGKKLIDKVIYTNESTTTAYDGWVSLTVYKWAGSSGTPTTLASQQVIIPPSSSVVVTFEKDVEFDGTYSVRARYYHGGSWADALPDVAFTKYTVTPAITTIAADGTETLLKATASYNVPADAAVVDLRGQSVVTSLVTTAASPNCLYLADTDPSSGITKNWVKGTTAANIELTDGYDFYTPIDFTAANISFTRRFTTGADGGGNGWNTIVLPFDVQTVKRVDTDTAIDWFKSSSDTGKNFWVYQFVIDGKGAVNFDRASDIKANTPYLITVPSDASDAWDAEFDLTGKDITFAATDVTVKANEKKTQSGFYYMFTGGSQKQTVAADAGYVLNAEGNKFAKTTGSVDVPAFQAYFYPSTHNLQADALAISFVDNSEATDIQGVDTKQVAADDDNWYTLQGVKLDGKPTEKGIYIYNGKKVAIK